jgi:hypothetical protein
MAAGILLMSTGKYLSLEEARRTGRLDRFCNEHPSVVEGSRGLLPARLGHSNGQAAMTG